MYGMRSSVIAALLFFALSATIAHAAWSPPKVPPGCTTTGTASPPDCNVDAPINVGTAFQDKKGSVWFDGGVGVNGGASGKMCVGSWCITKWSDLGTTTAASASPWTRTGTNVYPTTITDNVGIGIAIPTEKLHVVGNMKVNSIKMGDYGGLALP